MTDALIMDGALVGRRESDAAVEAVQAGVDLLLYPNDARRVRDALEQALASGTLAAGATGGGAAAATSARSRWPRARRRRSPAGRSSRPTPWPTRC